MTREGRAPSRPVRRAADATERVPPNHSTLNAQPSTALKSIDFCDGNHKSGSTFVYPNHKSGLTFVNPG